MNSIFKKSLACVVLWGVSNVGAAQVLTFVGCQVESPAAFMDAVSRFHASMEGGDRPTISLLVIASASTFVDCPVEGLVLETSFWGERDAEWNYSAVYPVATSDPAAYAAALDELATSDTGASAPGPLILYQNRAGIAGATHAVVILADTLTALNEFLDTLFASEDYADFADEVASIRTLGAPSQARRLRTWEP